MIFNTKGEEEEEEEDEEEEEGASAMFEELVTEAESVESKGRKR